MKTPAAGATVVNLIGKFDPSGVNVTFNLANNAAPTSYLVGASTSVHASFATVAGPNYVATFVYDTTIDPNLKTQTVTARETVNGSVDVVVSDACAGTATIVTGGSATGFTVSLDHSLSNAVQSTVKIADVSGATQTFVQNGANAGTISAAGVTAGATQSAKWTFDFSTAVAAASPAHYTLTVSGDGDQKCIADLSVTVTALGGSITIP